MASLASFSAGLFAVRVLEPRVLGAYALAYSAFNLLAVIPAHLLFVPAETAAAASPASVRGELARHTVRAGVPAAVVAALLLPAWSLLAPGDVPADVVIMLTATAAACTLLSPVQDHLRRMMHVAGRSRTAALMSAVTLVVVLSTLLAAPRLAVASAWIPLGALALANAASLTTGLLFLRGPASETPPLLHPRALARAGQWLLLAAALGPASAFGAAAMVSTIAGPETLGIAEAARVIGQPVLVLATGLSAVLGPRSVRAAAARRPADARRVATLFQGILVVTGVTYLAVVSTGWSLNPFATLVPSAYLVAGLTAAAALAALTNGALFPVRSELLGLDRPQTIARVDAAGAALRLGVSATAAVTGVFAIPLAFMTLGLVRWAGYQRAVRRYNRMGEP